MFVREPKPVWGRTALWTFVGLTLLTYVGVATNTIAGGLWMLWLSLAIGCGVILSIVSLVKHERRGPAITTLVLAGALPAAVVIGFVAFFSLFYVG